MALRRMNVRLFCTVLAGFAYACGDDDRTGRDSSTDTAVPAEGALGPQAEAHRARCEFFCDGKGDSSNACLSAEHDECVLACQSRLALVDTPCATCILDEAFIETLSDGSCRYFVLEEKGSEACADFCGTSSTTAARADRVARCRGFCTADAYSSRCAGTGARLDDCVSACMGRTELLTPPCATCLIDEFSAEDLEEGGCRWFFDEVTIPECSASCSNEAELPSTQESDQRCLHFCTGNGSGYQDGCQGTEREQCMDACRSQVAGFNSGCTACVLDHGFVETREDGTCRFSFQEVASTECRSFCAP